MSRIYQALKKAQAEKAKTNGKGKTWNLGDRETPPHVDFDLSPHIEEQYERLHANILVRQKQQIQTIMVVGSQYGDGVTTVASILARVLAKTRTVLLVDANLRTPALAEVFQVRASGGFAELLTRKVSLDGAVTATELPNLSVMTCGSAPVGPPYIFEVGSFDDLLNAVKDRFQYIIFDFLKLSSLSNYLLVYNP